MAIVINGSGTLSGLAVGGLPDGTVDAGTVAADVATQAEIDAKLNLAGGTMTGDLILGDNVKLEVGSASGGDLQIYHDGSNSYIDDAGSGSLILRADGSMQFKKASTTDYMARFDADGAATLYHNASAKIATSATGVAVTGKITGAVGSVLQTGTGTKIGEVDMNSGTLTDIGGLNVTLAPSAQSSKFLVMVAIAGVGRHGGCNGVKFNLQRTISGVGTVHRLIVGSSTHEGSSVNVFGFSVASMLLDVPNTTNNITWTVQNATANSTGYARINSNHGTNTVFSSITVQEIGA